MAVNNFCILTTFTQGLLIIRSDIFLHSQVNLVNWLPITTIYYHLPHDFTASFISDDLFSNLHYLSVLCGKYLPSSLVGLNVEVCP